MEARLNQTERNKLLLRNVNRIRTVIRSLREEAADGPGYSRNWCQSVATALEGIIGMLLARPSLESHSDMSRPDLSSVLDKIDKIADTLHVEGVRASARELRQDVQRIRENTPTDHTRTG